MIFKSGIYKITSPSNKIYIGQSRNIKLRWQGHKSDFKNKRHRCKIYNSFKKYGYERHKFEIIHYIDLEVPQNRFDELEQFYIDYYRNNKFELLNMKEAGCYGKHTEETKEKLRNINLGKKLSDETKEKIGNKSRGNKYRLGVKETIDTLIKRSKPVMQYSLDGEFIAEFMGGKTAERETGIPQANISENCRGKRKSAGGYLWKFK